MVKIAKINSEIEICKKREDWIEEWEEINELNRSFKKVNSMDKAD